MDDALSSSDPERPRVVATLLSLPPRRGSLAVAVTTVWLVTAASIERWQDRLGIASLLPATRAQVFEDGEAWRLFTSLLVHKDLPHLGGNAVVLGILSYLVYGYFGPVIHPILAAVLGAAVTGATLLTYPPDVRLVGASGVVYVLAGFWLTSYVLIERRFGIVKRASRAIGMGLIFLVPASIDPSVSHRAHAIGLGAGVILAIVHFLVRRRSLRALEVWAGVPAAGLSN